MKKVFSKKFLVKTSNSNKEKGKKAVQAVKNPINSPAQGAEELDIVAISMALYLHFDDQHEVEQTGFWLNRPLNQQTTWTAKDNLFRKLPIRKY